MRTLLLYILCFVAFASIGWTTIGASVVYASNVNYVPLAPIDVNGSEFTSTGANSNCIAPTCFPRYLRTIYNVGIAIAGLFAVLSIVRGGFTLLYTDSILGHSEGKGIILRSLGGLLIVYSSYIFMNAISPSLGRDLDLSLNFPRIVLGKDTSSFTVVTTDSYGKFLDEALKRAQDISQKAKSIKQTREELEKRIEEGEYKDVEEANAIVATIKKLQTAETEVRNYEGGVNYISTYMRKQIHECLTGNGACSVVEDDNLVLAWNPSGGALGLALLTTPTANKDQAANTAAINQMLAALRSKTAKYQETLRKTGLNDEAENLGVRLKSLESETAFFMKCPQSKSGYSPKLPPSSPCPP